MRSRGESKVKMIVRKGLGGQQDKLRDTIDVRLRLVRSHMAQKGPSISISKLNIHNCISNWVWGTSLEKIAYLSPCGIASSCDFISLAILPSKGKQNHQGVHYGKISWLIDIIL